MKNKGKERKNSRGEIRNRSKTNKQGHKSSYQMRRSHLSTPTKTEEKPVPNRNPTQHEMSWGDLDDAMTCWQRRMRNTSWGTSLKEEDNFEEKNTLRRRKSWGGGVRGCGEEDGGQWHMHKSGEQWLGRVVGCMEVIDYGWTWPWVDGSSSQYSSWTLHWQPQPDPAPT